MPDLQINIETIADRTGAQNERADIESIKQQATESNVEQLRGLDQLSEEGRRALGVIDKETKNVAHSHGDWHKAVKALRHEFPALYHVAHLALNPITAAVGAIAIGTHKAIEAFKVAMAVLKSSEWESSKDAWKAQAAAIEEAEINARKFDLSLHALAESQQTIIEKSERVVDGIRKEAIERVAIASAEEARDLARIDAEAKLGPDKGGISEATALERRLAVQRDYAKRRADTEKKARDEELANVKSTREEMFRVIGEAEQKAITDREKAAKFGSEEYFRKQLETARKNVESTRAELKKLAEDQKTLDAVNLPGTSGYLKQQNIESQIVSLTELLAVQQRHVDIAEEFVPQRIAEAAAAAEVVKQDEQLLRKLVEFNKALPERITRLQEENLRLDHQAETLNKINDQMRQLAAFPERVKQAETVAARVEEIRLNFEQQGVGVGRQSGREIGFALERGLKEFGIGVSESVVPMVQDILVIALARTKDEMRREFEAKMKNYRP